MTITLDTIGKRYKEDWIFKNVNLSFSLGKKYAITGHNGSGKSTLLKIISGSLSPTQGELVYQEANTTVIKREQIFKQISFAAPYIQLIEEYTAQEFIQFYSKFKPLLLQDKEIKELIGFSKKDIVEKRIKKYSSGMKQRLMLYTAMITDVPVTLLDEPTSNLDNQGVDWYHHLVDLYAKEKILILASNREDEYKQFDQIIGVNQYKIEEV